MKIELLYFEGCPSWKMGLGNLRAALDAEGLTSTVEVEVLQVKNDQEATQLMFLGSPSFKLNGEELWPEERRSFSLSCRIYATPHGLQGWPTVEMLRQKLHDSLIRDVRSEK